MKLLLHASIILLFSVIGSVRPGSEAFASGRVGSESGQRAVSAVVTTLSIDRNAEREGRPGVLVRMTLDKVRGLKGVTSSVVMGVVDMDDAPLMADTEDYASESGHLATTFTIKPGSDPASVRNVELFIPYSEFVVPKGTRRLKLDFNLIGADWEVLAHLAVREFEMTKK